MWCGVRIEDAVNLMHWKRYGVCWVLHLFGVVDGVFCNGYGMARNSLMYGLRLGPNSLGYTSSGHALPLEAFIGIAIKLLLFLICSTPGSISIHEDMLSIVSLLPTRTASCTLQDSSPVSLHPDVDSNMCALLLMA